jgi:hypothetical protein
MLRTKTLHEPFITLIIATYRFRGQHPFLHSLLFIAAHVYQAFALKCGMNFPAAEKKVIQHLSLVKHKTLKIKHESSEKILLEDV